MASERIILERRKTPNGWWATVRDKDSKAVLTMAPRGYKTFYSKEDVRDVMNNFIAAIKEDNFETRDI